ncbi:MAG TPA: NDP-sugar synthase [Acidimicrobiales bacterium]|nr:NDP-sugar synthase [Acidimicrobiales bacterium]
MRAVVLVGGQGTRLRPLTYAVPKQMLPVAGMTMLERVVGRLAGFGIDEVVLSLGYRPDAFTAAFPTGEAAGVRLVYAVEPEPLDTAGAIRFAAAAAGVDETFLVLNGDVLTDLDVGALVDFHRRRGARATLALTPVEDPSAFGVVPTDAEGKVTAFIEKPERETAPTNLINAGTYVLEPDVLDLIPSGRPVSVERATFPALVERGELYATASDAYWLDTGTPAQFIQACVDMVGGRRLGRPAPRPGVSLIAPGVWAAAGVEPKGDVTGPTLLEEGCSVEAGASVAGSLIGPGARVAEGAEVSGSVVMAGAVIEAGAVVSGSVVGFRARVGADARLEPVSVVGVEAELGAGQVVADGRWPPLER